jgi:hypothetical protein
MDALIYWIVYGAGSGFRSHLSLLGGFRAVEEPRWPYGSTERRAFPPEPMTARLNNFVQAAAGCAILFALSQVPGVPDDNRSLDVSTIKGSPLVG